MKETKPIKIKMTTRATKMSKFILKDRNEIHIARKLLHIIGVGIILGFYLYLSRNDSLFFLMLTTVFLFTVELLRKKVPFIQNMVLHAFSHVMRKEEINGFSGISWLFIGIFIIVYLFPIEVVTLSLLMLGIGDPVCNIIGIKYGTDKLIGNKSLQGTLAGFVACTIVSAVYFMLMDIMLDRWVLVSLLSGSIGAFAEAVPLYLDDNFVIPVINGLLLWGLFMLF